MSSNTTVLTTSEMSSAKAGTVVLLATALIRVHAPHGESRLVRALMDPGSEVTLIAESLVQQLRLPRASAVLPVSGIGGLSTCYTKGRVRLNFGAHTASAKQYVTDAFVLKRLTNYQPRIQTRREWTHLRGLPLADPGYHSRQSIEILLGADVYAAVVQADVRRGSLKEPIAQQTTLGWLISGCAAGDSDGCTITHSLQCSVDSELTQLVSQFWEQEEGPVQRSPTLEEEECEAHYSRTHQRLPSGRYLVRLPFKANKRPISLGSTRQGALRMLRAVEARFRSNPPLEKAYQTFMSEYLQLKHMTLVDGPTGDNESNYLPHHGVLKASSTTTKLRVVFNGSFPTPAGEALNDFLMVGPNLLPDLRGVLLRWRCHRYCLTADIEKMFRQIIVHPDDRRFQRILWRNDTQGATQDFELCTVTYGLACSPFLAVRTLQQLADDEADRFPRAAAILRRDVYMDDVLTGADSKEEARQLQLDLQALCSAGGFNLRKWTSNIPELRQTLDSNQADWQEDNLHATLGVYWNILTDCFQVRVCLTMPPAVTRRTVLSVVARIYDPLGLLAPVTVTAKILIQSLWLLNIGWDDALPDRERKEWDEFYESLPTLNPLQIPRWMGIRQSRQDRTLHGFADASERAYAAVVYLRIQESDIPAEVFLMIARTKVAPLKRVSLPRLELCAAVLLTRLAVIPRRCWG